MIVGINIAGEHFYTKNNHYKKFSYILDSENILLNQIIV